jgi:DNA-directed RNA polymerase beta subunit
VTRREPDAVITVLYPYEARTRDLTYNMPLIINIQYTVWDVDSVGGRRIVEQRAKDVVLGEIPIMVKSRYCSLHGMTPEELMEEKEDPDDPGGYFIIRGKEKVSNNVFYYYYYY